MVAENVAGDDREALDAVAEFLRGSLPFNALDDAALTAAVAALRVSYHPHGSQFDGATEPTGLRVLRSGAVDIRDGDNKLLDRLGEGESFHIRNLNAEQGAVIATVIEDALIYRLPDADYQRLRQEHRDFDRYFSRQRSRRLRRAARYQPQPNVMMAPVSGLMTRDVLTLAPATTVREAAAAMAGRRVSSAFIVEDGALLGVVTDRDLRTRVLAEGRPGETPLGDIMTPDPQTIDSSDTLFDTTLLMTQRGFHHLPVLEGGRLAGVITTSDLILARRDDPVYLVQHLSRQDDVNGVRELLADLPALMTQWVESGMRAQHVSRVLTAVSDAVAARLIQLAERSLGPAPARWAWLAFGSQARAEQLLGADQDNGIVIADDCPPEGLSWYQELAQRVCAGLAECGYARCPGGIMASNDSWRLPLGRWQDTVAHWARAPTPDAVMRVSIFFDLRAIVGDAGLARSLQATMLSQAASNTIFLAALAANALEGRPPLGIFRRFVVDRDGEHRDRLDIKKRGVLPLTEIVRVHALAQRVDAVNTEERLQALARAGHLALADSRNLADALHCVQRVRMQHQCEQVLRGDPVDNHVDPRALPRLAREQLRDTFTLIDEAQAGLRQRYRAGLG